MPTQPAFFRTVPAVLAMLRVAGGRRVPTFAGSELLRSLGLVFVGAALVVPPAVRAQTSVEARNMILVGHHDLNGNGDGGEGLVIQQWPDGRPSCISRTRGRRPA